MFINFFYVVTGLLFLSLLVIISYAIRGQAGGEGFWIVFSANLFCWGVLAIVEAIKRKNE